MNDAMESESAQRYRDLPLQVQMHVLSFLPPNEIACNARLVCKAAAKLFSAKCNVKLRYDVPTAAFAHRFGRTAPVNGMKGLPRHRKEHLAKLTAGTGNIENMNVLITQGSCPLTAEVMVAAAEAGHRDMCAWLKRQGVPLDPKVFAAAAASGNLKLCKWLRKQSCPVGDALCRAAGAGHAHICHWLLQSQLARYDHAAAAASARYNHVELMHWLLKFGQDQPSKATCEEWRSHYVAQSQATSLFTAAAAGMDLSNLQRLHSSLPQQAQRSTPEPAPIASPPGPRLVQNNLFWDELTNYDDLLFDTGFSVPDHNKRGVVAAAAGSRTPDWRAKVEWLLAQGYPPCEDACIEAAKHPDPARFQWLRELGFPVSSLTLQAAAEAGRLPALKTLLADGIKPFAHAPSRAAEGGHLGVVQALKASGCYLGEEVLRAAARSGCKELVVWLVEKAGLHMSAGTFSAAASSCNMPLLRWLYDKFCPCGVGLLKAAVTAGCEEVLEWLAANKYPVANEGVQNGCLYVMACSNGDIDTLRCLRRLGCPWSPDGETFTRAVREAIFAARTDSKWGNPELRCRPALRCMLDLGCPVNKAAALRAAKSGCAGAEMVRWLQEQLAPL